MKKEQACIALLSELCRAMELHPVWPNDLIHQVAIVAEESGEAVQAALNHVYHGDSLEKVRNELIQAGAMCIRAIVNLPEVVE
jgi:hypothetical protein